MKSFNVIRLFCIKIGMIVFIPSILLGMTAELDTVKNLPAGLKPTETAAPAGFGAALFQTVIALLFVLGIIYLSVWIMRKLMNKPVLSNTAIFKSLGDYHLDSKKKLSLVKIADRILVLGVTENAINLIVELDPKTDGKVVLESLKSSEAPKINFQNILNQFHGKQNQNETV